MNLVRRLGIFSFPSGVLFLSLFLHIAVAVKAKHAAEMQRVVRSRSRSSHEMKSVSHYPRRLLSSSSFSRHHTNGPAAAAFFSCRGRNTNTNIHSTGNIISLQSRCLRGGAKSPYSSAYHHSIHSTRRPFSNESEPRESLSGASNGQGQQKGQHHCISYLTDVEGDRDYLHRFVQQSRILTFRPTEPRRAQLEDNAIATNTPAAATDTDTSTTTSASTTQATTTFPDSDYFPYEHCLDFMEPNDILVYGGDVWDQGGSDLYVIRQLLDLQRRYPDRVHTVMGNRDMNKMRVIQELGASSNSNNDGKQQQQQQQQSLPPHGGVYWLKGTGRMGDPDEGLLPNDSKCAADRLRWMLKDTMGSPKAFEYRRSELEQERVLLQSTGSVGGGAVVTDAQVVESYRASCHPVTGEMGRYLANARLVVRLGDALFVHGCLPLTETVLRQETDADVGESVWDDLTFAMPWLEEHETARDKGVLTVTDWMSALNDFCVKNVRAWREEPATGGIWSTTGGYHHSKASQPFSQLIQYGMGWIPGGIRNPTAVYSSWCIDGMPRRFFPTDQRNVNSTPTSSSTDSRFVQATRDFFQRAGVTVICSGHQPQGDMPNAIRVDYTGTSSSSDSSSGSSSSSANNKNTGVRDPHSTQRTGWLLSCDTSYSGDTHWHNLPANGDDSAAATAPRHNPGRGRAKSGRGDQAVSEVVMEQCSKTGQILSVYCHGTLCDGTAYETRELDLNNGTTTNRSSASASTTVDLVVGRLASGPLVPDKANSPHGGPWWTRAAFRDGSYLLTAGEGFHVWNRIVKP
jgi:hypothetical protein